jgi:hypothetical protein
MQMGGEKGNGTNRMIAGIGAVSCDLEGIIVTMKIARGLAQAKAGKLSDGEAFFDLVDTRPLQIVRVIHGAQDLTKFFIS